MTRLVLALMLVLSCGLWSGSASADVGPKQTCQAEGKGCTSCWLHYGATKEQQEEFDKCSAAPKAKGHVEACRHRQGAGDSVYYCAPGVKVSKSVAGCGGCAIGAEGAASEAALAGAMALLGALVLRRRGLSGPTARRPGR